jgi:ketosteroid isomerase-like protein
MTALLLGATLVLSGASTPVRQQPPLDAMNELLAADRAFAAAAVRLSPADGLAAMFAPDVEMRAPQGVVSGKEAIVALLRSNPENLAGHLEWTPTRGSVSADATQGYTAGMMTLTRADSTRQQLKYISFWVRGPDGWKVRLFRRSPRADGPMGTELALSLPAKLVPVVRDAAVVARYAKEVDAAERAFSGEAGVIGLGPAFAKYGSADAINIGPPDVSDFVIGSEAIGKSVGGGGPPGPSKISWAPDHVVAASSGDFGATIGYIEIPADGNRPAGRVPFFTIWRRASPTAPWRYIAE